MHYLVTLFFKCSLQDILLQKGSKIKITYYLKSKKMKLTSEIHLVWGVVLVYIYYRKIFWNFQNVL